MTDVTVELDVLVTAKFALPRGYIAPTRRRLRGPLDLLQMLEPVSSQCLAFVVRHPSAGPIAIDTGFHPDDPVRGLVRAPAYDAQLRELGVEPAEISRVVMTHLHFDHAGGLRLLPQATVSCAPAELASARGRLGRLAGYPPGQLPASTNFELVDFDAGESYGPFSETVDLLGDGSIRLISTPGHTPGHLSVLLRTSNGQVLVAGDAVYLRSNLTDEAAPPYMGGSRAEYLSSLRQLAAFAELNPEAVIVPTHDPDAWRALV
jgi:glyoxylase-like metal-dependent hydrolase (beta-lactamase superfamily II)